jgi:hypothetical protein
MLLSEVEQKITKTVVRRLITQNEPTVRRLLLSDSEAVLTEALNRLVNLSVLEVVDAVSETFLPSSLAFHYCGDVEALQLGKQSTEAVLGALRSLFEQEPEQAEQKEYTSSDVETEVLRLNPDTQTGAAKTLVRIGLYIAAEFGVFTGIRRNAQQTEIVWLRIGERILMTGDINKDWENHIRQRGGRLESE